MKRALLAIMLLAAAVAGTHAQTEEKRIQRLSDLAKVWGTVKYFHPYLAYKEIDWDKALVGAVPRVNEAATPEQYAAALNGMLSALGDPQTKAVVSRAKPDVGDQVKGDRPPFRIEDGVLHYDALALARAGMAGKAGGFTRDFQDLLPKSKAVAIDARTGGEQDVYVLYTMQEQMNSLLSVMLDRKITLGAIRYRIHSGYAPQTGTTSGGYYSGVISDSPQTLGSDGAKPAKPVPVVAVVDPSSPYAEILSGLQSANKAFIVAESNDIAATPYTFDLADGVKVHIRTREIVAPDGSVGFTPDAVAPAGEAMKTAIKVIAENKYNSLRTRTPAAPAAQVPPKDLAYAEMEFPSKEYRLLALFRFWNVINYFFPYKHLIGGEWDAVLAKYIPKLEACRNAAEYQMVVREMAAETHDSHVGVRNTNAVNKMIGDFLPPVILRFIEGQTVVARVVDEKLPLRTGDVLLTVDGEDIGKRREFFSRLLSGSTAQALMRSVHYSLLRGQKDSVAKLTVRGSDGNVRTVDVARSLNRAEPKLFDAEKRTTPVFSVLPSGFGYVDLDRLQNAEVGKMFDTLKDTPGIIFDMRGYPNGTAWTVAPRLSDKKQPVAALFSRPILTGNSIDDRDLSGGGGPQFTFGQPVPPRNGDVYRGKIVMLIDEYAQSQSEHTALFFETARPDIVFIGTPTAGANGDVTDMVLPGDLVVSFSGHNVRHADGRQLQRLGIQPTLRVAPTIKGLAAGKDEIFDAAVEYLQKNR